MPKDFLKTIWKFHKTHRRDLPWRNTHDPYRILISEMMLQQTQVSRVLVKYREFLKAFPTLKALSRASIADVLKVWKGLGYNRRAFFLKKIADEVMQVHIGKLPCKYDELMKLPGIGQSTAGAVCVFSFEQKILFIETNIRAVIMHAFFKNKKVVTDQDIKNKLDEVLKLVPEKKVREFYYALYDYGTELKAILGKDRQKLHAQHAGYKKQSKFLGSNRQLRAIILQYIVEKNPAIISLKQIQTHISKLIRINKIPFADSLETKELISTLLAQMKKEGQIIDGVKNNTWRMPV